MDDNTLPVNTNQANTNTSPIAVTQSNTVYEPRELSMDQLTPAGKKELDLSGIVNVTNSLKNSLNPSNTQMQPSTQVDVPVFNTVETVVDQNDEVMSEEVQDGNKYNVLLVVAFVFFLIALGAAGYFLYLYLK